MPDNAVRLPPAGPAAAPDRPAFLPTPTGRAALPAFRPAARVSARDSPAMPDNAVRLPPAGPAAAPVRHASPCLCNAVDPKPNPPANRLAHRPAPISPAPIRPLWRPGRAAPPPALAQYSGACRPIPRTANERLTPARQQYASLLSMHRNSTVPGSVQARCLMSPAAQAIPQSPDSCPG